MLDCADHVALAGLTAAAWLGLGTLVLAPLRGASDPVLALLNRVGAGAVAFALLTFAAGLVDALYRAVYLPVFAVACGAGLLVAARRVRVPRPRGWPWWQLTLAALVAAYVVVELVVTCAPISSADALLHHAAAPELYARTHEFQELPWTWNSYQPYTVEMLVLDGILLHGLVQGAFAPLLLGLGALAATAGAAYRLLGRAAAVLAAAVFSAQAFGAWMLTSTFVEPGTAFFFALAVWNVVEFAGRDADEALLLAGVFAGAAAGTKYFGASGAAVFALVGAALLRDRLNLRRLALAAVPAVLVAAPWYVKNAVYTGDPVYPLLGGWPNAEAEQAAKDSFANYGFGRSPLDVVALPFRLLWDADAFDRGEFVSPLFLLFAPLALFWDRGRRYVVAALAACAGFVLVWFAGVQDSRYLLPLMPVLAVLAAAGILAFARTSRLARLAVVAVCAGAFASGAAITAVYAAQFVPVVAGAESRDEFLRENTPYYEGLEWLNRRLPPDARVALDHVLVLYSDRPAIAWTADALPSTAGAAETRTFVRRYRLTHAEVFASNSVRRRQLAEIGAREIGRVTVHDVRSRTLSEIGPPQTMLVYALPALRAGRP